MNILLTVFVVVFTSHQILGDEQVRYDNFTVHRITPKNEESVKFLRLLEDDGNYDFWTDVRGIGHPVDIMVGPHQKLRFRDLLNNGQFESELFVSNVQELIDNERPKVRPAPYAFDWTDYNTLEEINSWLVTLADTYSQVTLLIAGRSYEGRDILGVRVSFAPGNQDRSVFVESNIHAREWITSAVSTWILNELLTSTDPNVRRIADSHDWYFVPVFNPDGFAFTKTGDRLWRKTRTPYGSCAGADPNRNWNYHWNDGGTSNSPCSETYRGPQAFSEASTSTLAQFISTIGPNLRAYISFHSYSQLLLLPYGFSSQHLDNYDDLYAVGVQSVRALAQKYGTQFTAGNIVELLYVASGGSMDWVKGIYGTPITYTYELRDTGRYGFVLPANQILPSALETFDSFLAIFNGFDALEAARLNKN